MLFTNDLSDSSTGLISFDLMFIYKFYGNFMAKKTGCHHLKLGYIKLILQISYFHRISERFSRLVALDENSEGLSVDEQISITIHKS